MRYIIHVRYIISPRCFKIPPPYEYPQGVAEISASELFGLWGKAGVIREIHGPKEPLAAEATPRRLHGNGPQSEAKCFDVCGSPGWCSGLGSCCVHPSSVVRVGCAPPRGRAGGRGKMDVRLGLLGIHNYSLRLNVLISLSINNFDHSLFTDSHASTHVK